MYVRRDQKRGCCHEQDILQIAAALSPVKTKNDPFWEQAAQMALSAMISYVLEYLPRQEHHLGSVIRLLREMGAGVSATPGASSGQCDPAPAGDGERQL